MKKFLIILSSIILIATLTTFNPNKLNFNLKLFKIEKIELKNVEILSVQKLKRLFKSELSQTSLLIIDNEKINKILINNELIDYVELKKIYPSKLIISIYEKEVIAITNYKKKKYYLTKNGEKIKYFKNDKLEDLPNIFGQQKNFLNIYLSLQKLNFPISRVKSFYYFDIGRWDIVLKNGKTIKLPVNNFVESIENFIEIEKKINFESYSIFDYRIKDQLILN